MAAPRKFDAETRERAVRMYHEHLADAQCSKVAARTHVGSLLGVNPATLRNWVEAGSSPSSSESSPESAELKRLKRENAELRRANEWQIGPVGTPSPAIRCVISQHRGHRISSLR